ncbi:MAG: glycosyltransferase family 4 protein [bacterium]
MKVAFVTAYPASNTTCASHFISNALQNCGLEIDYIGPFRVKKCFPVYKPKELFYKHIVKKKYYPSRDPILVKYFGQQISKRISKSKPDIIFSPISPGSQPIAFLKCRQPIVMWTDTTFAGVINWYPGFSNLSKETLVQGQSIERRALNNCKLVIFSSDWAAEKAIECYGIEPSKVKVVSMGPYLNCNRSLEDVKAMIARRAKNKIKLLFLGREWYRKGGDVALQVVKELNRQGTEAELTIVGSKPQIEDSLSRFVRVLGRLNKSKREDLEKMQQALAQSHLLILPTRADCAPAAILEANTFGLPSLSTKVGAISTLIRDNINGRAFSVDANASEYCKYITKIFSANGKYKELALSTFNEYQTRLNWTVAGEKVTKMLQAII